MNGSKQRGLALAVALIAALAVTVFGATQALAEGETIAVERATVAPGEVVSIDLTANDIGSPGLGAWEIGIIYNPSVVDALTCAPGPGSVCNVNFASNQVRVTGATASGFLGDSTLATIQFACDDDIGTTSLTLALDVVADATVGSPIPIDAKADNGSIACTQSPFSPPPQDPPDDDDDDDDEPAAPTATPVVVNGLPPTGEGPNDGGSLGWLITAASAAAVAALIVVTGANLLATRVGRDD